MDIAAETVVLAEHLGDTDELLHGVVGRADDARRQEQALDIVAAIEVERELHDLFGRETRPDDVAGNPVHAIKAVVDAMIGEKKLQKRDAAAVGRVRVADAVTRDRPNAAGLDRVFAGFGAGGRARGIVFGSVGQHGQFCSKIQTRHRSRGSLFVPAKVGQSVAISIRLYVADTVAAQVRCHTIGGSPHEASCDCNIVYTCRNCEAVMATYQDTNFWRSGTNRGSIEMIHLVVLPSTRASIAAWAAVGKSWLMRRARCHLRTTTSTRPARARSDGA